MSTPTRAGAIRDGLGSPGSLPDARPEENAPQHRGARAGVPMARLFRVELRKLLDTRAGRWLAGATVLVSVLAVAAFLIWGDNEEATFEGLLGLAVLPLAVLLPILGIMSATAEWSQRTGMVTFALEPHRGRVVAAKLAAAAVLALGVVALAVAGTALAHLVAGAFLDLPGDWSVPGAVVGGITLAMVVYLVQGVAFGLVFLNTPLAIVLSLVLPTAFTIVGSLVSGFEQVARWLDLSRATEPLLAGSMAGQDWAQLGTASLVWLGVPLAVGTWRVLTREVA
ncbi:MAG: ABC transporter permease [Dermatophilaceae bacterium]